MGRIKGWLLLVKAFFQLFQESVMKRIFFALIAVLCCGYVSAAEPASPGIGKIFDRDLTSIEREIVPMAEAMPAGKFDFAPSNGEFKGVRTFGEQMKHAAAVIYLVAASVLEEKNPDAGSGETGPASMKSKEEIVQ